MADLNTARAFSYHLLNRARENGEDTSKPLAFVGIITILLGATMLNTAMKQSQRAR